jgi:hypothetical protein
MECTYAEAVKAGAEISWCQDKIFQSDIEYIRSDRRLSPETVERVRAKVAQYESEGLGWKPLPEPEVVGLLRDILKECGYE